MPHFFGTPNMSFDKESATLRMKNTLDEWQKYKKDIVNLKETEAKWLDLNYCTVKYNKNDDSFGPLQNLISYIL